MGPVCTIMVGRLDDWLKVSKRNTKGLPGKVLATGPGTPSLGMKVDSRERLWVAGGTGGDARVYDTRSGALLAKPVSPEGRRQGSSFRLGIVHQREAFSAGHRQEHAVGDHRRS